MYLTVFVEPGPGGFRATSTSPLALSADGPTADAAVEAVRAQFAARLAAGGEARTVQVPDVDDLATIAARMRANPLFEDYLAAVEEYRREHNTVPDPAEAG